VRYDFKLVEASDEPRKKHIAVDENAEPFIKLVYDLVEYGDGLGPPMGLKSAITAALGSRLHSRDEHRQPRRPAGDVCG